MDLGRGFLECEVVDQLEHHQNKTRGYGSSNITTYHFQTLTGIRFLGRANNFAKGLGISNPSDVRDSRFADAGGIA